MNPTTTNLALQRMSDAAHAIYQKEAEAKLKSTLCRQVGKQIKGKREAKAMTQAKLAKDAGIGETYLSRLESGLINPSLETLEAIAASMGLRVEINFVRIKEPSK